MERHDADPIKHTIKHTAKYMENNTRTTHMKTETRDFLSALIFGQAPDDDGNYAMDQKTPDDFSPAFIEGAEQFIEGFRNYLTHREIEIPESDRSFGGNVYFSLSGHGVGFWDSFDTEHLQTHLESYSGKKYRFEEIDLSEDENGKLDLSFIPSAIAEYRTRLFSTK
jgi:hypothetical protein